VIGYWHADLIVDWRILPYLRFSILLPAAYEKQTLLEKLSFVTLNVSWRHVHLILKLREGVET
jgi:hypothetical protein